MKGSFEAKKHAIRQTQDGWVVSFVIHPNDMTPEFAASPLGTHLMLAYAEVTDDEPEESAPTFPPERKPVNPDRSLQAKEAYRNAPPYERGMKRACMMLNDARFWRWLASETGESVTTKADADRLMKQILGIRSKTEISVDGAAHAAWEHMSTSFQISVGEMAEPR